MQNISKELNILNDYQMKFDDLLGDSISFFNKDMDTPDSFRIREALLEHDEECECLKCAEELKRKSR